MCITIWLKDEFSAANAAAAARGFSVRMTKLRTVVTKMVPVQAPVLEVVKKVKKVKQLVEAAEPKSTKKAKRPLTVVEEPVAKTKPKAPKKAG